MKHPIAAKALVVLATSAFAACGGSSPTAEAPLVVVSIFPIADLAARMAGDALQVRVLLPPRASPATWEATPAQIRMLARADGYVTVGGGLDGWLAAVEPERPGFEHLVLTEGMKLRRSGDMAESEASGDPHVWLDPILVRDRLLPRLTDFLVSLAPDGDGPAIRTRSSELADTLTALDEDIRSMLAQAPRRRFVATHDAWEYFAARYGLESVGSIYERPGHEPSAQALARLIEAARKDGVTTILAEPQLAETGARALAEELGAKIRVVDPLGGPNVPGRDSYTAMMRTNARAFALALGAR